MPRQRIEIKGMTCEHCALEVDAALGEAGAEGVLVGVERAGITHPQVAAVGLTDAQAQEQGLDCECRTLPLEYVPRAQVNLDTRGFVKIVAERASGRIRGVTAVAENAGDVILAAVYAVEFGLTVEDIARVWCPYLTMTEGFKLGAQIFSRDVSKLSCCAA